MRREPGAEEASQARAARQVAVVIAATMILWLGAQWIGRDRGWEARYVFLIDFAAIAAFIGALVATWRIWRRQRRGN